MYVRMFVCIFHWHALKLKWLVVFLYEWCGFYSGAYSREWYINTFNICIYYIHSNKKINKIKKKSFQFFYLFSSSIYIIKVTDIDVVRLFYNLLLVIEIYSFLLMWIMISFRSWSSWNKSCQELINSDQHVWNKNWVL